MASIQDNVLNLTSLVEKLNKELDSHVDKLELGAQAVQKYNKEFAKTPSEYVKVLDNSKQKIDALARSTETLTKVEKERLNASIKLNQEIRSNNATQVSNASTALRLASVKNRLTKEEEKQANAVRNLNSAYLQLSKKEAESARVVQDLIARGRTATQTQREFDRELRVATRDFEKYRGKVLEADKAVGRWNRTGERTIGLGKDLIGAFGIAGGVALFASITKDIFNTTKEVESLNLALKQVTETEKTFADSQMFLARISESYGIEIKGLTKQFTQFYVSAKDKISGKEIQGIFESVAKSAGFMGLSLDAQDRAFNALNQMMSKGTVSAEELKGQLGEALPGAFGIMAKAMGTTEQGLAKLMKDGKVLASEVLPKFAKELEKAYGIENKKRVDTLVAAQTRLGNAWTDFVTSLNSGSGILSRSLILLINQLTAVAESLKYLSQSSHEFQSETIKNFKTDQYQKTIKSLDEVADAHDRVTKATMLKKMATQNIIDLKADNEERLKSIRIMEAEIKQSPIKHAMLKTDVLLQRDLKMVRQNNQVIAKNAGIIMAANEVLTKKEIKNTQTLTAEKKKLNDKRREENELLEFGMQEKAMDSLIEKLERQKAKLELEQRQLSKNNIEWRMYQQLIDGVDKSIKQLTDTEDFLAQSGKNVAETLKEIGEKTEAQRKAQQELTDATNEWLKSFGADLFSNMGLGSLNFFTQIKENGLTAFQELMAGADTLGKKMAVTFNGVMEVAQEVFNKINEINQANFEAEYERLDKQTESAIEFAGDNEKAKERIEEQSAAKRREIQKREWKAKQQLAIVNIAIDTAQAVVGTLAATPPPFGLPIAAAMGALGAAQIALVASQKMPAFWKGTQNAPEGYAMVDELRPEVHTDKHGNIKSLGSSKGANVRYLEKGDKIYKSHSDYINQELSKNGINPLGSFMNFTLPTEIKGNDFSEVKQEISKLADVIRNKEAVSINIDEAGFRTKIGGAEVLNSRQKFIKRSV